MAACFDAFRGCASWRCAPATLLRRRPDIVTAEAQLAASDHALDAAREAFMPDVQLAAFEGLTGSNLALDSPFEYWSVGASILAPIFSGGRLEAQQDIATARRDQAAFAYRKTMLNAFREVEDALAPVRRDEEQERAYAAQRDVLERALNFATNRYRAGYSPYLDQIGARQNLLSVQVALVQSRADRSTALVSLYQALGGG
jgi:outer membrane protein TolC